MLAHLRSVGDSFLGRFSANIWAESHSPARGKSLDNVKVIPQSFLIDRLSTTVEDGLYIFRAPRIKAVVHGVLSDGFWAFASLCGLDVNKEDQQVACTAHGGHPTMRFVINYLCGKGYSKIWK